MNFGGNIQKSQKKSIFFFFLNSFSALIKPGNMNSTPKFQVKTLKIVKVRTLFSFLGEGPGVGPFWSPTV